ncbi:hypothetical protein B484DRAFT_403053, partial [Ochromonadaceae sp. CCMP2298]
GEGLRALGGQVAAANTNSNPGSVNINNGVNSGINNISVNSSTSGGPSIRNRHLSSKGPKSFARDKASTGPADEAFNREMKIFNVKRAQFEQRLLKKRADREREFRSMGMSAATAKLAAYNELLLDEQ